MKLTRTPHTSPPPAWEQRGTREWWSEQLFYFRLPIIAVSSMAGLFGGIAIMAWFTGF